MIDGLTTMTVAIAEHVATVTLDRPPVNAQNPAFRHDIQRVFDTLHDLADVRAIILTGAGKTFSAGADLKARPGSEPGAYPAHNRLVRAAFDCVMECDKPVIAAVNGAAIGAGCVLALCADIILVSDNAFLSMTEVDVGLAGGVRHVMRHFGQSDARLMIYTARRITGPELLRMNVASACVAPDALLPEAHKIAAEIAQKVPLAIRAAKRGFGLTEDLPLSQGYRYEQSNTVTLAQTEDFAEAQAAFAEKRRGDFKGR